MAHLTHQSPIEGGIHGLHDSARSPWDPPVFQELPRQHDQAQMGQELCVPGDRVRFGTNTKLDTTYHRDVMYRAGGNGGAMVAV